MDKFFSKIVHDFIEKYPEGQYDCCIEYSADNCSISFSKDLSILIIVEDIRIHLYTQHSRELIMRNSRDESQYYDLVMEVIEDTMRILYPPPAVKSANKRGET